MVNSLFEQFVENNLNVDTKQLALHTKNVEGVNKTKAITQIGLLQKASKKIPTFFLKRCLFTPKSYEQATSERVATYKSLLVSGKTLLDLTGGLGVDDYFFSKNIDHITSLDPDKELNEIARYNFTKLKASGIERVDSTAEDYIKHCKRHFDIIYADPDRRDSNRQRKIHVKDWQPDIIGLLDKIFEHTETFALKLSPLFDLDELFKLFPNTADLYVISENGEVKELFCIIKKSNQKKTRIIAVDLSAAEELACDSENQIHFYNQTSDKHTFLYEAGNALVKGKLWQSYGNQLELDMIEKNTPLFLLNKLVQPFMGRVFKLVKEVSYKSKDISSYLAEHQITKANITRHYFNENVEQLRKRWKLKDGGKDYLFFANDKMYHCEKIDTVHI